MKILIIEDEIKTARALAALIQSVYPLAEIVGIIQSIEKAVQHILSNENPDLIFMDIQLSDGLSFEIFKEVKINSPVIFCTAFDEYAIDAFKANGIDYILKPFSKDTLIAAFEKVKMLSNSFQSNKPVSLDYDTLLKITNQHNSKKSFLVFKGNKYVTIATDTIALFYMNNEMATMITFDEKEYLLNQSMDAITAQLSNEQFYRLNRQYLINFDAVLSVEPYFLRKLFLKLKVTTKEQLLISKHKTTEFLGWLEKR